MKKIWRGKQKFFTAPNSYRPNTIIKILPVIKRYFFMKCNTLFGLAAILLLGSCSNNKNDYDASGNFEADEVIVSAEQNGKLLSFDINEGDQLSEGAPVG